MGDAIIALTSNLAMHRKQRIEFKDEWFDPKSSAVPDPEHKPDARWRDLSLAVGFLRSKRTG